MRAVPIIFSGWNHRAIIAFCRFCKNSEIPALIVAKNDSDPILLTDYKDNVILIRQESDLTLGLFQQVKAKAIELGYSKCVLMPTTEYLNRFYLSNRKALEDMGYRVPLCDERLYEIISDKIEFESLCKQYGIATPKDYAEINEVNIPFVVKPQKYFFQKGTSVANVAEKPKLILSKEDFESVKNVNPKEYYCQEFIGGEAYYLLYYFAKDGSYSVYSQKNLMQQHGGLSIVAAEASTIHEDPRTELFTKMFLSVGFHGLVMVEFRDYKGQFYMIEANPRFWGPSQLILDAGMDLFERFAKDNAMISEKVHSEYKPGTKYSWFGGVVETSSLHEKIAYHNGYTAMNYIDNISTWLDSDIYRRKDTMSIWEEELKH